MREDNLQQRFDLFLKVDTEQVQIEFNSDLDSITISPNINRNVKIFQKIRHYGFGHNINASRDRI